MNLAPGQLITGSYEKLVGQKQAWQGKSDIRKRHCMCEVLTNSGGA